MKCIQSLYPFYKIKYLGYICKVKIEPPLYIINQTTRARRIQGHIDFLKQYKDLFNQEATCNIKSKEQSSDG